MSVAEEYKDQAMALASKAADDVSTAQVLLESINKAVEEAKTHHGTALERIKADDPSVVSDGETKQVECRADPSVITLITRDKVQVQMQPNENLKAPEVVLFVRGGDPETGNLGTWQYTSGKTQAMSAPEGETIIMLDGGRCQVCLFGSSGNTDGPTSAWADLTKGSSVSVISMPNGTVQVQARIGSFDAIRIQSDGTVVGKASPAAAHEQQSSQQAGITTTAVVAAGSNSSEVPTIEQAEAAVARFERVRSVCAGQLASAREAAAAAESIAAQVQELRARAEKAAVAGLVMLAAGAGPSTGQQVQVEISGGFVVVVQQDQLAHAVVLPSGLGRVFFDPPIGQATFDDPRKVVWQAAKKSEGGVVNGDLSGGGVSAPNCSHCVLDEGKGETVVLVANDETRTSTLAVLRSGGDLQVQVEGKETVSRRAFETLVKIPAGQAVGGTVRLGTSEGLFGDKIEETSIQVRFSPSSSSSSSSSPWTK